MKNIDDEQTVLSIFTKIEKQSYFFNLLFPHMEKLNRRA